MVSTSKVHRQRAFDRQSQTNRVHFWLGFEIRCRSSLTRQVDHRPELGSRATDRRHSCGVVVDMNRKRHVQRVHGESDAQETHLAEMSL